VIPGAPIHQVEPPKVIHRAEPSHRLDPNTRGHLADSQRREQNIRGRDQAGYKYVTDQGQRYRDQYRNEIVARTGVYRGYYSENSYRYYYSDWYRHGFYGGYYYPVRAYEDIESYFTYPVVYWMFAPDYDDTYWRTYYHRDWDSKPTPASCEVKGIQFSRVLYPTDTVKDLGVEISALDACRQSDFRRAMETVLQTIQSDIGMQLGQDFQLGKYSVVINHYKNLRNQAIVIEGFSDQDDNHFAFKALLDLVNPGKSLVFVPNSQDASSATDLAALKALNDRIVALGGDPYTADDEPQSAALGQ
jgi:hypothetical protein